MEKYYPEHKVSMDVEVTAVVDCLPNIQGTDRKWKKFQIFESNVEYGNY